MKNHSPRLYYFESNLILVLLMTVFLTKKKKKNAMLFCSLLNMKNFCLSRISSGWYRRKNVVKGGWFGKNTKRGVGHIGRRGLSIERWVRSFYTQWSSQSFLLSCQNPNIEKMANPKLTPTRHFTKLSQKHANQIKIFVAPKQMRKTEHHFNPFSKTQKTKICRIQILTSTIHPKI